VCKASKLLFWLAAFCIPEMILYPLIFKYIRDRLILTAKSGILVADVIKNRRQKNSINIFVTCLSSMAQVLTVLQVIF
jgi:hypothetical protein